MESLAAAKVSVHGKMMKNVLNFVLLIELDDAQRDQVCFCNNKSIDSTLNCSS